MSLPVGFRPAAWAEYVAAIAHYDGERPDLGSDFETEVQAVLGVISNTPDRYAVVARGIREAPLHRFPYSVFDRVRNQQLVVIAVFHQSRDPKEWQSRG